MKNKLLFDWKQKCSSTVHTAQKCPELEIYGLVFFLFFLGGIPDLFLTLVSMTNHPSRRGGHYTPGCLRPTKALLSEIVSFNSMAVQAYYKHDIKVNYFYTYQYWEAVSMALVEEELIQSLPSEWPCGWCADDSTTSSFFCLSPFPWH